MLSKLKRPFDDHGSVPESKKSRISESSLAYLRWKMWLLRNCELKSDSTIAISSIVDFSTSTGSSTCSEMSEEKENMQDKVLSTDTLGRLVKEIWKGRVKRVKRGARGRQESHYLHLARKPFARSDDCSGAFSSIYEPTSMLTDLQLPSNWSMIRDKEENLSFIRIENFLANDHRAVTEVSIVVQNDNTGSCTVRANGNSVCLNLVELDLDVTLLTLREQITQILLFVENSDICEGYQLLPDEKIAALVPYHLQHVRDLKKTDGTEAETRAFSDNCSVILATGRKGQILRRCSNCTVLKKRDRERKKRKQQTEHVHPKCNKRYLDKDEIEKQLQSARMDKKKAVQYLDFNV